MIPVGRPETVYDPIAEVRGVLEDAWEVIGDTYEVSAKLPNRETVFEGADLHNADQAAEQVVVNMLSEAIEYVGRFSPWYKLPARSFGLTSFRDPKTNRTRWTLAPEAVQKWQGVLEPLTATIEQKGGMIEVMLLVDELNRKSPSDEPVVLAECSCSPPRKIKAKRSVLEEGGIICDVCEVPFVSVEE
jgi:hypothetical protein